MPKREDPWHGRGDGFRTGQQKRRRQAESLSAVESVFAQPAHHRLGVRSVVRIACRRDQIRQDFLRSGDLRRFQFPGSQPDHAYDLLATFEDFGAGAGAGHVGEAEQFADHRSGCVPGQRDQIDRRARGELIVRLPQDGPEHAGTQSSGLSPGEQSGERGPEFPVLFALHVQQNRGAEHRSPERAGRTGTVLAEAFLVEQDLPGQVRVADHDPDSRYAHCGTSLRSGERLAKLALGSTASTELPPERVAAAREIIRTLTRRVPEAFAGASADTLLGRCREAGPALEEATGLASLMLVAGTETAAGAMARRIALIHDTGRQQLLLAHRELIPAAVREGLRVSTPAPVIGRHVSAEVTVAGRLLRADERILLLTYTADNAAGGFDIARPYDPRSRQLWFGAGRHLCLGAPVARAEIARLLTAVFEPERPYRIVSREYARKVMIPSYASLVIALDG
jgi:Cytochrome P450